MCARDMPPKVVRFLEALVGTLSREDVFHET
jgi:hypothetical protein